MGFSTDSNGIARFSPTPTGDAGQNIDSNFGQISSLITEANSLITALQAAVTALTSTVSSDTTSIGNLGTTVSGHTTSLASLTTTVGTHTTSLASLATSLAAKAPIASPTFTGTVTGTFAGNLTGTATTATSAGTISGNISHSQVTGLGSAALSNTSAFDSAGAASTALATAESNAAATYLPLAGGSLTGNLSLADTGTLDFRSGNLNNLSVLTVGGSYDDANNVDTLIFQNGTLSMFGNSINMDLGGGTGGGTLSMDGGQIVDGGYGAIYTNNSFGNGTTSFYGQFNGTLYDGSVIFAGGGAYITTDNDGGINFVDQSGNVLNWNQWDQDGLSIQGNLWFNGAFNIYMNGTTMTDTAGVIYDANIFGNNETEYNAYNIFISSGGGINFSGGGYIQTDNEGGFYWQGGTGGGINSSGSITGVPSITMSGGTGPFISGVASITFADSTTQTTAFTGSGSYLSTSGGNMSGNLNMQGNSLYFDNNGMNLTSNNDGTIEFNNITYADMSGVGILNLASLSQGSDGSLGFFGNSPVGQQTGTGSTATGEPGGAGTQVYSDTEFQGNGGTEYTINDIVIALKSYGLLQE
jgi:hypothetical protein